MSNRKICSIDGCERSVIARGWCPAHYKRWRKWGTPAPERPVKVLGGDVGERFWPKVEKRGPDECWPWMSSTHQGYGQFYLGGGPRRAHRVAYEFLVGPIPEGFDLDHDDDCDRGCCNPAHLTPRPKSEHGKRHMPGSMFCKRGHLVAGDNAYRWSSDRNGRQRCRTCYLRTQRARRARP